MPWDPNKPIDWNQLFRRTSRKLSAGIILFLLLFLILMTVVAPVLWLANKMGKLGDFFGDTSASADPDTLVDYRKDLDEWGASHHMAFRYSEVLACSMNADFNTKITDCLSHLDTHGKFDGTVDLTLAPSYSVYQDGIQEYQGLLDPTGYLDLWIPTLYAKDHFRQQVIRDPVTHQETTEWVLDYTEDTVYKDECSDNPPETACRITRKGFWTYPYLDPKGGGTVQDRYGFLLDEQASDGTMKFQSDVTYSGGDVHALSTGIITEEADGNITIHVIHNGLDFYVRYSGLSSTAAAAGDEVEWNQVIGSASEIRMETYMLQDGIKEYFNPMLLIGSQYNYGAGDYQHVDYDPGNAMDDDRFAAMYNEAIKHLGKPYVLGTQGPDTFDCSGFIWWVLNHSGVMVVSRLTAQGYYNLCNPINAADAKPGDLVFFEHTYNCPETISHIGIYLGDGMMINAGGQYINGHVVSSVCIVSVWHSYVSHYGRLP